MVCPFLKLSISQLVINFHYLRITTLRLLKKKIIHSVLFFLGHIKRSLQYLKACFDFKRLQCEKIENLQILVCVYILFILQVCNI